MANIFRPGSWLKGTPIPNTESQGTAHSSSKTRAVTTSEPKDRVAVSAEGVSLTTRSGSVQDQIGVRAYFKWLQAGQPQGNDSQFWLEAEREILEEMQTGKRD